MSDLQVHVRDNLDALSEHVLHDAFIHLVRGVVREMREVARTTAPKDKERLVEHIEETEVVAVAEMIEGKVGVKPVEEADDDSPTYGEYRHSRYPLFVEGGTRSIIFPAKRSVMFNREEGILFRRQVRGQKPQPFMAAAYAQAHAILDADQSIHDAMREMAARAAAERAVIESE